MSKKNGEVEKKTKKGPVKENRKTNSAGNQTKVKKVVATNKEDNVEEIKVSKIKLSDKGSVRHAIFLNPKREAYVKRRMDGGLVCQQTAADWMLSKHDAGDVVVELKGGDVSHAITQVTATAEFAVESKLACGRMAALILCTQHPGIDTKMQRAMNEFAKRFKGPIHTRNKSGEFVFEHVLSFNGPDRM